MVVLIFIKLFSTMYITPHGLLNRENEMLYVIKKFLVVGENLLLNTSQNVMYHKDMVDDYTFVKGGGSYTVSYENGLPKIKLIEDSKSGIFGKVKELAIIQEEIDSSIWCSYYEAEEKYVIFDNIEDLTYYSENISSDIRFVALPKEYQNRYQR